MKKRVLVFPCGSEIGLEINRALVGSRHFQLWGASSVPDHGRFVYERYIENLPSVESPDFVPAIQEVVDKHQIDFIMPAHDSVVLTLAEHAHALRAEVVTAPVETCRICRNKRKTYQALGAYVPVPTVFTSKDTLRFPVFLKPEVGQGSKGVFLVDDEESLLLACKSDPSLMILEFLPGPEYTVDCFTDRHRNLLFAGARRRMRISNGISVHTEPVAHPALDEMAKKINDRLVFRGAWFFQARERANGEPVLMEIAPRIAGSMALHRSLGVNLTALSLFDRMNLDVDVLPNRRSGAMDRALVSRYESDFSYQAVYVDLDDCLIADGKVNGELMRFLYQARNEGKQIFLLSRHRADVHKTLKQFAIASELFDQILLVGPQDPKSAFIHHLPAIFIDDSHAERKEVRQQLNIPVFAPDAVEALINWKI